ncbi:MAG: uncharacterized protein QOK04_2605 [Solirubrobacteraceae bacterium]|nr:uncharacterized protein [Solirubrobacteraceae bacterium]
MRLASTALRPALLSVLLALLALAGASAEAAAQVWTPGPAKYGARKETNVPVTMSDGTVLRANIYYPTDPATGKDAPGPFPVIMVQTPYGKDTVGATSGQEGGAEAGTQAGAIPYMISRGYIDVVAEVRGTGDSGGSFNLLDPVQGRDGAELVNWASKLPGSNGRVGLYGPSYMGIDQYMTANAVGPGSPLKALFPIVAGNDTYRDIVFQGGLLDAEFDLAVITTIFGPLELANPAAENPTDVADLIKVESQHAPALLTYNLDQITNISTNGEQAYDEAYWQARAPRNWLERIVRNGIPAFAVDGWFDLYQRGAPLNYSGLQNAWAGRPVGAPMLPGQKTTGRYQLLQGPWYHLDAGTGFDIFKLELAWFDRWLKDQPTGIDQTYHPLHVYDIGARRWIDTAAYPFKEATPHTFYLDGGPSNSGAPSQNDGRLTTAAPTAATTGADQVLFTGASSPCNFGTEQWSAGGLTFAAEFGGVPSGNPCTQDDRTIQTGPGALTYTTPALTRSTVVAGPVDATIYATSTRPDVEFVATLEDIAPSGVSRPLTTGALLGSFRALDHGLTWYAPDGRPIAPYHPFTRASVMPVETGAVTRFDIEVFPTLAEIPAGHRLRLTLTTSDSPHLLPTPLVAPNLAGGVYQVQRRAGVASFIEVPTASPGAFAAGDVLNTAAARRAASRPKLRLRTSCRGRRLRASIGGADRKLVKRVDYRLAGRRAGGSTKLPFARSIRLGRSITRVRLTAVAKLRDGRRATLSQRVRCDA